MEQGEARDYLLNLKIPSLTFAKDIIFPILSLFWGCTKVLLIFLTGLRYQWPTPQILCPHFSVVRSGTGLRQAEGRELFYSVLEGVNKLIKST